MDRYRRSFLLILVMIVTVTIVTGATIWLLYETAFHQETHHLMEVASGRARLLDAIARFDTAHSRDYPGGPYAATLTQVTDAQARYRGFGRTGEFNLARREGDRIVFVLPPRHAQAQAPMSIPFLSEVAEPMRRALEGQSGVVIGPDYRGERVLAAYEPVPTLGLGVVAKIDLAELRAPFEQAGLLVSGAALTLTALGVVLFVRLGRPIVRQAQQSEQRYERIFTGALVPIWQVDLSGVRASLDVLQAEGVKDLREYLREDPWAFRRLVSGARVKEVNPATLRLLGARSKEEFREWFRERFVGSCEEALVEKLCALWDGQSLFQIQTTVPRMRDGGEIVVLISMLIPDAPEELHSIPVSMLDVSADVALREREEQLRLILASTGEGIFGMDLAGRCTFANRSAAQLLGYRDENELLGQDMHERLHPTRTDGAPHPREECPLFQARRSERVVCLDEETLWRADGSHFPAEYRSYPMLREGTLVGTVVTFVDVSERKEKEAELRHAHKLEVVGQLTGNVAHDFNNLLTVILGNLSLLSESVEADPDAGELVDDAFAAAEDAAELTRGLLAFSRKQKLEPRAVRIDQFLDERERFLRRVIGENIELTITRAEARSAVLVDPVQLQNALLNLTINARDAMPQGGRLAITAAFHSMDAEAARAHQVSPGRYLVLSVQDTGTGMPPEVAAQAIEPFFTTKSGGKGSGLGLSTVYGFVKQSGGGLEIETRPGLGTRVSLLLPEAHTPVEAPRPKAVSERPPSATATILVVEDEPRVRNFAMRVLRDAGYRVLGAEDAAAAQRILEQEPAVRLLFSDIVMPGDMNGRALARWAQETHPELQVLLTTGFSSPPHAPSPGASDFVVLTKPYSRERLVNAVGLALVAAAAKAPPA